MCYLALGSRLNSGVICVVLCFYDLTKFSGFTWTLECCFLAVSNTAWGPAPDEASHVVEL